MPKDDPDALAEFQRDYGSKKHKGPPPRPHRPSLPASQGQAASTHRHAATPSTPAPAARPPASIEALRELLHDREAALARLEARLQATHVRAEQQAHEATQQLAHLEAQLAQAQAARAAAEAELGSARSKVSALEGRVAQLQGDLARVGASRDGANRSGATAAPEGATDSTDDDAPGAIASAMRRFNEACLLNGVTFLVVVGGSPRYHEVLRAGKDRRIDLRLVEGNVSRPPRFPPRTRIFVWGATELDHAVSNAYPDAVTIPHRGISRFLDAVSARIDGK